PRAEVLRRSELTEDMLVDPDGRVPFEKLMLIWDVIADRPGFDRLGVTFGRNVVHTELGVFGWMLAQSSTMREAADVLHRYGRLLSEVFAPRLADEGGQAVWHQTLQPRYVKLRQPQEWAIVSAWNIVRHLTRKPWQAREAWVQHARPDGEDALSALLEVEVRYGAPEGRLVLDGACLDAPVHGAQPALKEYLERTARERLAQLPGESEGALADRVQRYLTSALARGLPTQAEVAKHLGVSERTLQRRLADEGSAFATLLDTTRRELAVVYLAEKQLAVYEIALLLGYADPSAFHRAFRRWTGVTPSAYRERV
ncbi:MAG: AraC family transcriptional regulator, partial [Kofleriaceae bacterium]|nr:AraC family transcriptional regulator [Kofleriaceae bacterium]